jgi:hypothetical protein
MEHFSDTFIDPSVNNPKGETFPQRFIDVMSDPSNLLIPRVPQAGTIQRGNIVLHNGLLVPLNSYYGSFSRILTLNRGCHEPSEERMFAEVLQHIPRGGVMIELGSYWAFYSMWFHRRVIDAHNYCVEPNLANLHVGMMNCRINQIDGIDFTQASIGHQQLTVCQLVQQKHINQIDLLHSDIQGAELEMLQDAIPLLDSQQITYLFVSTHSDQLHYDCMALLQQHHYRIIASADYDHETFCYDGILVACPETNQTIPRISLGCRQKTPKGASPPSTPLL